MILLKLQLRIRTSVADRCGSPSMVTAVCVFSPGASLAAAGILTFLQETPGGKTNLSGTVMSLTSGPHSLSIYEFGDYSKIGCLSFGSRFDPFGYDEQAR
ncbi:superoxide dismutase [Cu-Zn] [Plakobranchus ocellatus]|uniref:Superoxide dismutase [Cu-Zn] n=1 Tax=Plakobranchus ocellatus TaxID=259542 RepID=A0AAV3ZCM7_9GAST|nr:superoxide dismutase [Cu-Zn] [Plakobranchus ocellatus]